MVHQLTLLQVVSKGVEKELKWIFWMWCLAHRLELAIKDALKGTFFDSLHEMLLQLYYIYKISPKNIES